MAKRVEAVGALPRSTSGFTRHFFYVIWLQTLRVFPALHIHDIFRPIKLLQVVYFFSLAKCLPRFLAFHARDVKWADLTWNQP